MKHTIYIRILLILSVIWISSCQDDDDMFPQSGKANYESAAKADVTALLNKYSGISHPDMIKSFTENSTVAVRGQKQDDEDLMIEWEKMQSFKKEKTDIYLVPLRSDSPIAGLAYTRIEGKKHEYMSTAFFKLQVRKTEGKLTGRVMTYIPDGKYRRQGSAGIAKLGYDLSDSDYSGVCLYSTLDGIFVYGEQYDKGKLLFRFRPSILEHSHENPVTLHGYSDRETASPYKIHVNLFNDNKATRAAMYSNTESGEFFRCSICGKPADDCMCVTIMPENPWGFCWECGSSKRYCICCKQCGHYPCQCGGGGGYLPGGGTGGGSGSGTGGGGGGTGGGSSTGSGGSSGVSAPSNLKLIFGTNTNLTQAQVNRLSSIYDTFVEGKVGSKLLHTLLKKDIKINFRMDPLNKAPASFDATHNEIIFKNDNSLSENAAFTEEMTHALQYYGYYNNTMTPAIGNYDFEAKLLGDVDCKINCPYQCGSVITSGMLMHSEYRPFANEYDKFIEHIGNDGWNNDTDEDTYYKLCKGWIDYVKQYEPNSSYANFSMDGSLSPKVVIDIYKKRVKV